MKITIPEEYSGTIITSVYVSPTVVFQQIRSEKPTPFIPGQYASFLLDIHRRPLSFASVDHDVLDFAIDITPGGVCSKYAAQAKPGQTVRFLAPYGRFVLEEPNSRPILFVATGTGIAPIRAQLQNLFLTAPAQQVTLVFGNYDEGRILFRREFEKLAEQYDNFTFIPVLSDPNKPWVGETGWVTHVVPRIIQNLSEWSVYICGNPNMVRDMQALVVEKGLAKEHIHSEQFTYANRS